ncbi:MAG: pseudouridine synthase, partial [Anaerotignaceae bacterium]
KQMTQGSIKKEYTAVVCGDAQDNKGQFVDFIRKNQRLNTSEVVSKDSKDAKKAVLNYEIVETIENDEFGRLSLVKIELLTGRHHQIRVQFANRNLPLWGDTKYNTYFMKRRGFTQISLISTKIAFKHPKNNKSMVFDIKPEGEGFGFFKGLQGEINNETN